MLCEPRRDEVGNVLNRGGERTRVLAANQLFALDVKLRMVHACTPLHALQAALPCPDTRHEASAQRRATAAGRPIDGRGRRGGASLQRCGRTFD